MPKKIVYFAYELHGGKCWQIKIQHPKNIHESETTYDDLRVTAEKKSLISDYVAPEATLIPFFVSFRRNFLVNAPFLPSPPPPFLCRLLRLLFYPQIRNRRTGKL